SRAESTAPCIRPRTAKLSYPSCRAWSYQSSRIWSQRRPVMAAPAAHRARYPKNCEHVQLAAAGRSSLLSAQPDGACAPVLSSRCASTNVGEAAGAEMFCQHSRHIGVIERLGERHASAEACCELPRACLNALDRRCIVDAPNDEINRPFGQIDIGKSG